MEQVLGSWDNAVELMHELSAGPISPERRTQTAVSETVGIGDSDPERPTPTALIFRVVDGNGAEVAYPLRLIADTKF